MKHVSTLPGAMRFASPSPGIPPFLITCSPSRCRSGFGVLIHGKNTVRISDGISFVGRSKLGLSNPLFFNGSTFGPVALPENSPSPQSFRAFKDRQGGFPLERRFPE